MVSFKAGDEGIALTVVCASCKSITRRLFRDCHAGDVITCSCGSTTVTLNDDNIKTGQRALDEFTRALADLADSLNRKR